MNFELNKIAGAVLGTALGVMMVGLVAEALYAPPHNQEPGYAIAIPEPGDETPTAPSLAVAPIADRMQTANVAAGRSAANKCTTCHTFDEGGATKAGPNLWGVVGAPVIHVPGYRYSDALQVKGAEGMTWTFENLDHFLENPRRFISGTAMAFPGIRRPEERADIIAYLRTLSDSPVPLPAPTPTAEATPTSAAAEPPDDAPEQDAAAPGGEHARPPASTTSETPH